MKITSRTKKIWDVVVIGGGPAGMMAATTAADTGATVLLLEKNQTLGKKLRITGGGRCNVTNNRPVNRDMLEKYPTEGKFLFSTFSQHGVSESINWFTSRGVELKEENEQRLFPVTDSAETIFETLYQALQKSGVDIESNSAVKNIVYKMTENQWEVQTVHQTFFTKSCILATGGLARPETGSTGDGFELLQQLGHTIVPNNFALVPLTLKNNWVRTLSGVTLSDIKLTIRAADRKHSVHTGKLLFTHVGVTGPTILNMSKTIGELLSYGSVTLLVDLLPQLDDTQLKEKLNTVLSEHSNKKIRNTLGSIIPAAVAKVVLEELLIAGDTPCHSVSKHDRVALRRYLKAMPLEVAGLLGSAKAVISAGGVDLTEVHFKTMESLLCPHLYIVGDLLNINRPSGGYSLQLCWSTGWVAGQHAGLGSK